MQIMGWEVSQTEMPVIQWREKSIMEHLRKRQRAGEFESMKMIKDEVKGKRRW